MSADGHDFAIEIALRVSIKKVSDPARARSKKDLESTWY